AVWKSPFSHERMQDRNLQSPRKVSQRFGRTTSNDAVSGQEHGTLRSGDCVNSPLDLDWRGLGRDGSLHEERLYRARLIELLFGHILRQLHMSGTGFLRLGDLERFAYRFGNDLRLRE